MIEDPTCYRNNGLEIVGSSGGVTSDAHGGKRDASAVGAGVMLTMGSLRPFTRL